MDGPLADDLFFAVHDPFSGRPRASEGRADVCLAAALICELLLGDHVRLTDGGLVLVHRPLPEDPLAQVLLTRLGRQLGTGPQSPADWIADVTPSAAALVRERLTRSGRGVQVRRRRFGLIGGTAVAATEATVHELAVDRLAAYLRNAIAPAAADLMLAVLVLLAEPRPDPLTGSPAIQDFVLGLVTTLPDDVQLVLRRADRVLGGNRIAGPPPGYRPAVGGRGAGARAPGARSAGERSAGERSAGLRRDREQGRRSAG